jgi:hypothetical protein
MKLSNNAMKIYEILKAQYVSAEGCWKKGKEMIYHLRNVLNLTIDEFDDAVNELEQNNIAFCINNQIELSFKKKIEIAKEQGKTMQKRWEKEIIKCNWSKDEYNKIYQQLTV